MSLPANIRVNTSAPFPSLVTAIGPITLAKQNGIWKIGLSIAMLGVENVPSTATTYLMLFDSIAGNFFKIPLASLPITGARLQRSVTGAGSLPITVNDQILNVNAGAPGLVITIPLAVSRSGAPLTFNMLPGSSPVTLTATAPDTLDGQASLVLNSGGVTLTPYTDGVNNALGYAVT
jgi:hypothetical protein